MKKGDIGIRNTRALVKDHVWKVVHIAGSTLFILFWDNLSNSFNPELGEKQIDISNARKLTPEELKLLGL